MSDTVKRVIYSICVGTALTCAVVALLLRYGVYGDDTEYADEFSERGFKQVQIGMSKDAVERILGAPLTEEPAPVVTFWCYAKEESMKHIPPEGTAAFFSWVLDAPNVRLNEADLLLVAHGDLPRPVSNEFVGCTSSEIIAYLGEPQVRYERVECHRLVYSRPRGAERGDWTHRVRYLVVDQFGTVVEKVSEFFYD